MSAWSAGRPASLGDLAPPTGIELTVVIPTFNERDNIAPLVGRLVDLLGSVAWEVVFVDDDSPDGTADIAKSIASRDTRVRCIRRIGRRGLSGACLEGMLASSARYVAVMDADLQHDEAVLMQMLDLLRAGGTDLVIGSRYAQGGETASGSFSGARLAISRAAGSLARRTLGIRVSDPMSGFFMMRRQVAEAIAPKLTSDGFKIMFDILTASSPGDPLRVREIPYTFRARHHGESKFDARAGLDYLGLVSAKLTGGWLPPRAFGFAVVGVSGVAVHLLALKAALSLAAMPFTAAQAVATLVAMTSNFALNNVLTYRDRRLTGWAALAGWLRFCAICSVGVVSNVGVAGWLYEHRPVWWLAGLLGSVVGAGWNFALSSLVVWPARNRGARQVVAPVEADDELSSPDARRVAVLRPGMR